MPTRVRRHATIAAALGATLALSALTPAASSATFPGAARSKTCAQISGCSTSLTSLPRPMASPPGGTPPPPAPASRLGVVVATAPTATPGTGSQSGKLVEKVDLGRGISCRGYQRRDTTTFAFQLLTATPLSITYDITDRIKNASANGVHFCLAARFPFKTLSGQRARGIVLPDGTRGHVGLLPPCANRRLPPGLASAPCVAQMTTITDSRSATGVDVILRVRIPTRTTGGDPWGGA